MLSAYSAVAFENGTGLRVAANAQVEVRDEATSGLAFLFSDRAGTNPISNPFNADTHGRFTFYVSNGLYSVQVTTKTYSYTLRHQEIGHANATYSQKGVASFNPSHFNVVAGAVEISGMPSINGLSIYQACDSLADDAEIIVADGVAGFGYAHIGDDEEWINFAFDSGNDVTVLSNTPLAVNTDTDGNLCVYNSVGGVAIKNRLGDTKALRFYVAHC